MLPSPAIAQHPAPRVDLGHGAGRAARRTQAPDACARGSRGPPRRLAAEMLGGAAVAAARARPMAETVRHEHDHRPAIRARPHAVAADGLAAGMGRRRRRPRERPRRRRPGRRHGREHRRALPMASSRCRRTTPTRAMAPRPVPGVPAVDKPSRMACADVGDAGPPRSSATISTDDRRSPHRCCSSISPPPACLTRLLAGSVATSATRRGVVLVEAERAREIASPRGAPSPTWLASTTRIVRVDVSAIARSSLRVPSPGRDSMWNSFASRLAPPRPRPRPAAARVAVPQRLLDVGDARAAVLEGEAHAAPRPVVQRARSAACRRRRSR